MWPRLVLLCVVVASSCSREEATATGARVERPADPAASGEPTEQRPGRPGGGFERFYLTGDEAACPSEARGDCRSFAELLSDGTLRMNPWGEPGSPPTLETHVPDAELAAAIGALRDPALLALLARARACADANQTETMLVRIGGTDHHNATGYCNDAPLQAARAAIQTLTNAHFPDHSLISPPF